MSRKCKTLFKCKHSVGGGKCGDETILFHQVMLNSKEVHQEIVNGRLQFIVRDKSLKAFITGESLVAEYFTCGNEINQHLIGDIRLVNKLAKLKDSSSQDSASKEIRILKRAIENAKAMI